MLVSVRSNSYLAQPYVDIDTHYFLFFRLQRMALSWKGHYLSTEMEKIIQRCSWARFHRKIIKLNILREQLLITLLSF